jgi:membrane protease YdiL (CAAX protease family)
MTRTTSKVQSAIYAIILTYGSYLLGAVVVLGAVSGLPLAGVGFFDRPVPRVLLSSILLQGVTFGGVTLIYLRFRDLDRQFVPFSLPNKRDAVATVVGIVAVFGILFGASNVLSYLGLESAQNVIIELGRQDPTVFLVLIPVSYLLIGPGEELLYRGLVQGTLRESLHPVRAIVLASALFASIHLFSLVGSGKTVYIGLAFVLALVLGASYEYTDNLAVPAVIHGTFNAAQFAGAYVMVTGGL